MPEMPGRSRTFSLRPAFFISRRFIVIRLYFRFIFSLFSGITASQAFTRPSYRAQVPRTAITYFRDDISTFEESLISHFIFIFEICFDAFFHFLTGLYFATAAFAIAHAFCAAPYATVDYYLRDVLYSHLFWAFLFRTSVRRRYLWASASDAAAITLSWFTR